MKLASGVNPPMSKSNENDQSTLQPKPTGVPRAHDCNSSSEASTSSGADGDPAKSKSSVIQNQNDTSTSSPELSASASTDQQPSSEYLHAGIHDKLPENRGPELPSDVTKKTVTAEASKPVLLNNEKGVYIVEEDPQVVAEWKTITTDESLPLLDLENCWRDILNAPDQENSERTTKILCNELKHYFWNQVIIDNPNLKLKKKKSDRDFFDAPLDERIKIAKEMSEGEDLDDKADSKDSSEQRPIFSEALLFKLRCHDKNLKKETPKMSCKEDLEFMQNILTNLKSLQNESAHFYTIAGVYAMEMTPYFFAKMVEGNEMDFKELHKVSKEILMIFAENASPKEMHLMIKTTVHKVGKTHYEGTAYFSLCDMMEIWGKIIVRIKRKRAMFLFDMIKLHENLLPCAESYRSCFGLYDEIKDAGGLTHRLPNILIKMFSGLLDAQEAQWDETPEMQAVVDKNGGVYESRVVCCKRTAITTTYHQRNESQVFDGKVTNADPVKSTSDGIIDDWLLERQIILVFALDVTKDVTFKLQIPTKKDGKQAKVLFKELTSRLSRTRNFFNRLGWSSALRAVQLSTIHLYTQDLTDDDEILRQGLGPIVRFSTSTKYVSYSSISLACFLFLAMRKSCEVPSTLFDFELQGTGFEFLEPSRAFDLALPSIMTLASLSAIAPAVAGVHMANMFLSRINKTWDDQDVLRWRYSLSASSRDVAMDGLVLHIGRLTERVNDPDVRVFVYETMQKFVRKMKSPQMRFSVLHSLVMEVDRIAVAAQIITELKDVLAYGDELVHSGSSDFWSVEKNDKLRSRFIESLYQKYLLPRKDSLAAMSPIIALCMSSLFVAIRDKNCMDTMDDVSVKMPQIEARRKYMKDHLSVAKQIVRALCSCSEHDIQRIPEGQLKRSAEKRQLYEAAGRTLNQGMSVIAAIDSTLAKLDG